MSAAKREERQVSVWLPGLICPYPQCLSLWPPWTLPGVNLRPSGCTCRLPSLSLRGRTSSLWFPSRDLELLFSP